MDYKGADLNAITSEVDKAIALNNTKIIDNIFHSNNYSVFTLDEKEKLVFQHASLAFSFSDKGEDILKYLIFDYAISLDNSFNVMQEHINDKVQNMFKIRKLNEDLHSELVVSDKFQKAMKV